MMLVLFTVSINVKIINRVILKITHAWFEWFVFYYVQESTVDVDDGVDD